MLNIVIDDINYPIEMLAGFQQDYKKVYNSTTHRSINGTPFRQVTWSKLSTTISGNGWIPTPLLSLSYDATHRVKCAAPISIANNTNEITLPDNLEYRWDDDFHAPQAYACIDGTLVRKEFDVTDYLVTITPEPAASYYVFDYLPIITCIIDAPSQSLDSSGSSYSWSISMIEV